jgi:hypothetical protein
VCHCHFRIDETNEYDITAPGPSSVAITSIAMAKTLTSAATRTAFHGLQLRATSSAHCSSASVVLPESLATILRPPPRAVEASSDAAEAPGLIGPAAHSSIVSVAVASRMSTRASQLRLARVSFIGVLETGSLWVKIGARIRGVSVC